MEEHEGIEALKSASVAAGRASAALREQREGLERVQTTGSPPAAVADLRVVVAALREAEGAATKLQSATARAATHLERLVVAFGSSP